MPRTAKKISRVRKNKKSPATSKKSPRFFRWMDIGAFVIAFAWFLYNVTLPEMYKGRICCDSVNYIDIAKSLHSVHEVLGHYGWRTLGFPLFLKAHQVLFGVLWMPRLDFVYPALFTMFLMHVGGCLFLYRSILKSGIRLHRMFLWLLLLHPGLVSHTGVPLTDGFATSLTIFAVGCLLRVRMPVTLRSIGWAALSGIFFAWLGLTRPAHIPPSVLTGVIAFAVAVVVAWRTRTWSVLALPIVALCTFGLLLLPRTAACYKLDGHPCIYTRPDRDGNVRVALGIQLSGARTYSLNWTDTGGNYHSRVMTVHDALFVQHFSCLLEDSDHPLSSALGCYKKNIQYMPFFIAKKTIALFDNFHTNSYAAYITHWPSLAVNRLFGLMGFLGFVSVCALWMASVWVRKWHLWMLGFVHAGAYFVLSIIPSTDSRYGFPLIPFAIAGFVCIWQSWRAGRGNKWMIAWAILTVVFLVQAFLWDLQDPLFRSYYFGESII